MAVGGAAGAIAPAIISSVAYADSGTVPCRFALTAPATFIATINRPGFNLGRYQIITITNPTGTCPCGGTPVFMYAYWVRLNTVSGQTGWVNFSSAATNNWTIGGGNGAFTYSMEIGVRVECPGTPPTYICRFGVSSASGAASYTVPATAISSATPTQLPLSC